MTDDRTITIGIDVDSDGAVRGIKRVEGAAVDLEQEGGDSGLSFGETMNFALGELAASAARELGNQIGTLISQGRALLGRAAEINETQSKFNTVFGESSRQVQEFVESQAQLMGLTQQRAQELLATAGSVAQGAGLAKKQSADMSVEIAQLAGDLASFNNAKPQRTFEAITSALTGEREQLKQFGIVIQENMVQQRALANTSKESAEALTQQEKAVATLELAYDKAGEAVGDLERTSESAANTGRQAGAAWREVRDTFAEQLLPAAAEINQELLELAENEEVMQATREAAQALSEQLTSGIKLASSFFQLFAENRESLATAADATFRLVTAVGVYVAAVKAQTLWTKRAVIAQKAATVAQRGLNAAMKANPIGLVVSALTVVLPFLYRFRDGITDAAAAVLDFSANAVRSLQSVVDRLKTLASQIPDAVATGPLAVFKGAVQGLGTAVDASADTMEGWAESLRKVGEESKEASVKMGEQEAVTFQDTQTTQENSQAQQENTQAQRENAAARREVASATREQVEAQNEVIDQGTPDFSKTLVGQADSIRDVRDLLRGGLLNSIQATETAISNLQEEYENATGAQRRRDLQALIEKLKKHRDELDIAQKKVQEYGKDLDENLKAEAVDAVEQSFLELGTAIGQSQKTIASFGDAAKSILADLASTIAKQLIAIGSAVSIVNPVKGGAFIAAGVTLQAISARIRSSQESSPDRGGDTREPAEPPSFQEGVENFEGGLARVHEDELLVNLAPGTSVLPSMTMPRSPTITTGGVQRAASAGGASAADIEGLERKLDEVAQRFEEKQFRLRGTDQVTQQERTRAELDDAGIK